MTEIGVLTSFFEQRGVSQDKAVVMARQLLKRAEQLAKERNIEVLKALEYLLELMISGQKGEVYEGSLGGKGIENSVKNEKKSKN